MTKNNRKNSGRFLSWFSDKVYDLERLFGFDIESELFQERLPEIMAGVYEIRTTEPKIREIYGKTKGIKECLAKLDHVLFEVEKLILVGPLIRERKNNCRTQLYSCARELADIWITEYCVGPDKQTTLVGPQKACLLQIKT